MSDETPDYDPDRGKLQTYSAPLSYIGATKRLLNQGHDWVGDDEAGGFGAGLGALVKWTVVWLGILGAWIVVTAWYIVALGVFGIFTIPFRFIRRSQRRQEALALAQLEVLEELAEKRAADAKQ